MTYNSYMNANALLNLLKTQPLNKITVTQITKESNLTRQTFYRNFEDKEDLVNWYFEKLCLDSFKEMADQTTLKEALIKKFTFIQTKTTIDTQLDFLLQMYCHGSIEMTKSWVEKNMYLDIETLVNMLIESMPERLKQYINL